MFAPIARLLRAVAFRSLAAIALSSGPAGVLAQPVTQPFTFSNAPHTLPHVEHGDVALGDVDGDGDLDAFVSGLLDGAPYARLFQNEGRDEAWRFTEVGAPIPDVAFGAAAWGDYDGDGDLDLFVTGSRSADVPYDAVSRLYRNDAAGLVEVDVDLDAFYGGGAAWADLDNDGDLDLVVGGERSDGSRATVVYRNDDSTFTEAGILPGIAYGDVAPADFDGDGDLDLALTGASATGLFAAVYRNDDGVFSPIESPLEPVAFADLDWGDFDRDGDLDLLVSGGSLSTDLLDARTRLYRNDGGSFSGAEGVFPDVFAGASTWGDYDNDGDLDALLIGAQGVFDGRLSRLYASEGDEYVEKVRTIGITFAAAALGDLEGDGDLDLVVTGLPTSNTEFVNIYENERQVRTAFAAPETVPADVEGSGVTLSWHPHPEAASYNVRVGSRPGAADVASPMADLATGHRLVARTGNAQQNLSRRLRDLPPGTYHWSVQAVDAAFFGSAFAAEQSFTVGTSTSAEPSGDGVSLPTRLFPAAPNPSAGPITLRYSLSEPGAVELRVYDVLGRTIATLVDRYETAGERSVEWDGRDGSGAYVGSGTYVVHLRAGSFRQSTTVIRAR